MADPPLQAKVAALSDPATYPGCDSVQAIETHMSWVFLADGAAYKMKKPVRRCSLDFSTLELRHRNCAAEVVLNRRLSDGVYHGLTPLIETRDGRLCLSGDGRIVEWLVRMRRLDAANALDTLIVCGATPQDRRVDTLVERLAHFYQTVVRIKMPPDAYAAETTRKLQRLVDASRRPELELPTGRIDDIVQVLRDYLAHQAKALEARSAAGHIVEGHGDLRPEHVFLEEPVQMIDCLEFSRDVRCQDVAEDLSVLRLECARLGARDFGETVVAASLLATCGEVPPEILDFHTAHKALQRAMLAILHNVEPETVDREKWRVRTLAYLDLAAAYAGRL